LLLPGHVQRPDVQPHHAGDHEAQQVVEREEARQRRVVDREPALQPGQDAAADHRDGPDQLVITAAPWNDI
jgi:hypothetical protein